MATVSFDEKVVVSNPEVDLRHNYRYTHEKGQENARKWLLYQSNKMLS